MKKDKKNTGEEEDNKRKSILFSLFFMFVVVISLSFIEFEIPAKTNNSTSRVKVPPPLPQEIKDFVTESHKAQSKKPSNSKKPSQSKNPSNNSNDELTDDNPDNNVSNPFGGSGGGSEFGGGSTGGGNAGGGNGGGGDGDFGNLIRTNAPKPPTQDLDVGGNICIELTVNDKGTVLIAKSIRSCTKVTDQNAIKNVVDFIKKNVKFKAQPGAPIRKHTYTVYIQAG